MRDIKAIIERVASGHNKEDPKFCYLTADERSIVGQVFLNILAVVYIFYFFYGYGSY